MINFKKKSKVKINKSYDKKGIIYDISYKDIKIIFPLLKYKKVINNIIQSDYFDLISVLEDLWLEDILLLDEKLQIYYIQYEQIYELEDEIRNYLLIPKVEDFQIIIKSSNFLGHSQFSIDYEIIHPIEGKLGSFYTRHGCIICFNSKEYLLSKEQYKLIEEIDNYRKSNNINDQALHIAKVKKKAEKAYAVLDDYLKNETCYFPEKINLDLVKHSDHHIELIPLFEDLDDNLKKKLASNENLKTINSYAENNRRQRIFIADKVLNSYKKIMHKKNIKDVDVPRFINNPQAYLPDEINIEEFSDRVKGLKIRTYKTQPFIKAKRDSKNGWFDFNIGVNINLENEIDIVNNDYNKTETTIRKIDTEEFRKLVSIAKENGEDYVYYKNNWIKIDSEEGERFLKAKEIYDNKFKDKQIGITDIPYILDIYDNLQTLEYDLTLIELKKELQNNKLLTYQKPPLLNAELYEYQKDGYQWLRILNYSKLGGLLADDMGLGKTLQVISLIAYLKEKEELKPSIAILPSVLIENWKKEIEKFIPRVNNIYIHRGYNRYKTKDMIEQYDLVLTTYETLVRDQLLLGKIDWKLIVCDEAQKIKNFTTLVTSAVKALKSRHRIALTGTPVENGLNELWSIMDYVQPGLLKSYDWFRKTFEIPIQKNLENEKIIESKKQELIKLIQPVFLRRTKEEKLDNLPNKYEYPLKVPLSEKQVEMYIEIVNRVKKLGTGNKMLAYLQQLIQICSHPRIILDETSDIKMLLKECNKLQVVIELLDKIRLKQEKVIIFTKYRKMQNILKKVIQFKFGLYPNCINGDITANRVEIITNFENTKGFNVLILSPKAAGVGLNIVEANHVIHYTREWNPAVENQATDRVYRIGQKKDVHVYYPICISSFGTTVEERLDELLKEKKKLFKEIIIPTKKLQIKEDDFKSLF